MLGADAISVTIALPRRSDRLALPDAEKVRRLLSDHDTPPMVDRMTGEEEGVDDAAKDDAPVEEDERAAADAAGAEAAPAKRARESRRCVVVHRARRLILTAARSPPARAGAGRPRKIRGRGKGRQKKSSA